MKIGIIGGTGPQGQGLALRLAKAGYEITIGSRSSERAENIAKELSEKVQQGTIAGKKNEEVVQENEILLVTVPYDTVTSTLQPLVDLIKKKTRLLIDVTVPMAFEKGKGMVFVKLEQGCMLTLVKDIVSPVPVVGAFKTISAHALLDIEHLLNRDTFVYGPKDQREEVMELISKIETLRPINAGPSSEGETIERLVPFLININRRYKVKDSGIKIVM